MIKGHTKSLAHFAGFGGGEGPRVRLPFPTNNHAAWRQIQRACRRLRSKVLDQRARDLGGNIFLKGQAATVAVHQLTQRTESDAAIAGLISDVRNAVRRQEMMRADHHRSEIAHHNDTTIAAGTSVAEDRLRIHAIAGEQVLCPSLSHSLGRLSKLRVRVRCMSKRAQKRGDR